MMQENVNWFGDLTNNRLINVTDDPVFVDDYNTLSDWNSSGNLNLNNSDKLQRANCIAFKENASKEFNKIFPNPSSGVFQIVLPENLKQSAYEVYNNMGSLLKKGYFSGTYSALNMNGASKGTYFLRVKTDSEVYIERIIIN